MHFGTAKPNEVIHCDYVLPGDSYDEHKYELVVKDDLIGYCWLEPAITAYSEHTAEVLERWYRIFTTPNVWVLNQVPQFKNEAMEILAATHRLRHNFSVAYYPWVNGIVGS